MKLIFITFALFALAYAIEDEAEKTESEELVSDEEVHMPADSKGYYPCNKRCGSGIYHAAGKCNSKTGRCDCVYGYTGPNSSYQKGNYGRNAISADHCTQACHYTHDYRNKHCVYKRKYYGYGYRTHHKYYPAGKGHGGHVSKPYYGYNHYDQYNCHWKCGSGRYHAAGQCVGHNKCLCWWGWTGAGAKYVRSGKYKNRVIANYCTKACHYTHDYSSRKCGYLPKYYNN